MRIAVLCSGYGWVSRGAETFLHELMQRLQAIDSSYRFDVYTRGTGGAEEDYIRIRHVPAVSRHSRLSRLYAQVGHHLRYYWRPPANFEYLTYTLALLPRLLVHQPYDGILNFAGFYAGILCQLIRRSWGTPFLHKVGSVYNAYGEEVMARQNPDIFVSTSPANEEWIRAKVPWVRIRLIPEAVDTHIFQPGPTADLGLTHSVVMPVGAMVPMKRPHLVVEAVARLEGVSLLMIGQGPLQEEIQTLALEKLGSDRFEWVPKVEHNLLPRYYNTCDVFTLASEEPTGSVFLEAMACNKPVVAHTSPVQAWMFGDGGLLCDCTDLDAYAATLKQAITTPFGDAPRHRAAFFEWDNVTKSYDVAIKKMVGGPDRVGIGD